MMYTHELRVNFCFPNSVKQSLVRIRRTNSGEGFCAVKDAKMMQQLAKFLIILNSISGQLPAEVIQDVVVVYIQFAKNDQPLALRLFSQYIFTEEYVHCLREVLNKIFCEILNQPKLGMQITCTLLNNTLANVEEESDF